MPEPGDPQSLNRYSYAANNPVVYTDPNGHQGIPGFPNPWEWFAGLFGVPSSSEFADKTGLEEYRSLTADVSKSVLKYSEQVGRRLEVATETGMNMLTAGGYDILTGVIGKNLGRDLSTPERITRISSSVVGMGVGKVVEKTLTESLARTFMGAKYTAIELSEDIVLYSAGSGSRGPGQFFSFDVPVSETQVRIDKAIRPFWPGGGTSPIDTVFKVKVPAGTVIYVGEVGYQGEFYLGGTNQVVIPSSWLIKGLEVLEKWEIIK